METPIPQGGQRGWIRKWTGRSARRVDARHLGSPARTRPSSSRPSMLRASPCSTRSGGQSPPRPCGARATPASDRPDRVPVAEGAGREGQAGLLHRDEVNALGLVCSGVACPEIPPDLHPERYPAFLAGCHGMRPGGSQAPRPRGLRHDGQGVSLAPESEKPVDRAQRDECAEEDRGDRRRCWVGVPLRLPCRCDPGPGPRDRLSRRAS
jgi:hypothetical protein